MLDVKCGLPASLYAQIRSDQEIELDAQAELLMRAYIPGIEACAELPNLADISISHQEVYEDLGLERSGTHMILRDTWKGKVSPDLYHLLYSATRV